MLKLLLLLLTLTTLSAESISELSEPQKALANSIYSKGKKFDLGYTMVAIAYQESHLGKYRINLSDPSCGIFHIMPKSLIKRTDLTNNSWNRSRLCERLILDDDFSFSAALLELKYWENYWKSKGVSKVWSHMVASYNGGFNATLDSPYLKAIKHHISILKKGKYNVPH